MCLSVTLFLRQVIISLKCKSKKPHMQFSVISLPEEEHMTSISPDTGYSHQRTTFTSELRCNTGRQTGWPPESKSRLGIPHAPPV